MTAPSTLPDRDIIAMVHRQVARLRRMGELPDRVVTCPRCHGSRNGMARERDRCGCRRAA